MSGFENQDNDADQYFEPLDMACDTRQPRLMEIALDALHFLIGRWLFLLMRCFTITHGLVFGTVYCSYQKFNCGISCVDEITEHGYMRDHLFPKTIK